MADENDPDRPEDDPSARPPGEGEKPAEPEPPQEASGEAEHDLFEEANAEAHAPEASDAEEVAPTPIESAHEAAPVEPETASEIAAPEMAAREQQNEEESWVVEAQPSEAAPSEPPPGDSTSDLPPAYFRAAGDPEEPEDAPPTQWGRLKARVADTARDIWRAIEPHWIKVWGATRGAGGEVVRRVRSVKPPRNVKEAAVWTGWAIGGFVALVVGFFFFVTWDMPSTDDLWEARNGQSITFLDRNGHVILREGAQNAPPVDLASLPAYVPQAFIAIEDKKFYHHFGVDIGGMLRAGAENFRAGHVVQGGSTLTQQLAKNLFLSNERSWRRKLQEIAMAVWLETRFSKDEILALYLSRVYFGAGAYGIEAASERYFDRPARQLTLLQAAMLAGLVKAPSRMNPASQDITAARARAEVVLNEMVSAGYISAPERDAALREELVISRRNPAGVLSYYRDWIDPLLNEVIGTQRDAFVVETTIDLASQRAGAQAVESVLAEQGADRRVSQGSLVAMDDSGGVRAMVGGRDYEQSQFNRVTQAHRQPGSSFKYFIYLAAMENGLTPWSVREDAPITIHIAGQPDWSPGNYTHEYHGPVSLTSAFANSFNMVAIRVCNEVGGDRVIEVAHRLGIQSELHNYHSLALGAQEVTLLEMVGSYGAMASEGYRVEPHGVARIRRVNTNETMWAWRPQHRDRVIEERPMRLMNLMMSRVVQAGTGTRARIIGRDIGGKTGTGNDYRDAWFIGFTPGLVAGVWVGNDNFTETARVTGGSLPADIWARFMPTALRNVPVRPLQMPTEADYSIGVPPPETPQLTAVGAPVGATLGATTTAPPDNQDRSLDFGPEG